MCRPGQTPHDNVFRRIGRREAGLGSKKRGDAPPPFHGISKITLKVSSSTGRLFDAGESPRRNAPGPSPGRHAATRSRRGSGSAVHRRPTGYGPGTPVPGPRANPFPEVTDPFCRLPLPTLFHRPEACRSHGTFPPLRPSKFSFEYLLLPPRSAPTAAPPGSRPGFCGDRRALLLIGARHLPRRPGIGRALKRHPFSGLSFAPIPKSDERFARRYRLRASTEFPAASPRSGIVHHLSGPDEACSHSNPSRKIKVGRRCNPQGDPAGRLPYALRV
ncbi:unnamed protein product [Prunus brigantina]